MRDPASIETDLRNAGFNALTESMLEQLQRLAQLPFRMEIQFDMPDTGELGHTLPVSLALDAHGPQATRALFGDSTSREHEERKRHKRWGAGAHLLDLLESWGVADARCRLIPNLAFAHLIPLPNTTDVDVDANLTVVCVPAFIKLKWEDGALQLSQFVGQH